MPIAPLAPPVIEETEPSTESVENVPSGSALLRQAAENVFRLPAVEAKVRQRVELFGHELIGAGLYRQSANSEAPLPFVRWEMKLQADKTTTTLQQTCDGEYAWTRREATSGSSLRRVDLRKVRRTIDDNGENSFGPTATGLSAEWMAIGGLSRVLYGLDQMFDFASPRKANIGKVPMWILVGHWKTEKLAGLVPQHADKIRAGDVAVLKQLPPQFPHQVTLTLSREEDELALFPYRIEYQRPPADKPRSLLSRVGVASSANKSADSNHAISTLEFFEVKVGGKFDERTFNYEAGKDEVVVDDTDRFLQNLAFLR